MLKIKTQVESNSSLTQAQSECLEQWVKMMGNFTVLPKSRCVDEYRSRTEGLAKELLASFSDRGEEGGLSVVPVMPLVATIEDTH